MFGTSLPGPASHIDDINLPTIKIVMLVTGACGFVSWALDLLFYFGFCGGNGVSVFHEELKDFRKILTGETTRKIQ